MSILIRYSKPSKFDKAIQGTLWRSMGDDHASNYFIQTSKDIDTPKWEPIGEFFARIFEPAFDDETFIEDCFALTQETESIITVSVKPFRNSFDQPEA